MLLKYAPHGRYAGNIASDYILCNAIAPFNLKGPNVTNAWVLETVRGMYPSEELKISLGALVCAQDRSRAEFYQRSESPAVFMRVKHFKWREITYHVVEAEVHVYSHDTYTPVKLDTCTVAIPTCWIAKECRLGVCAVPTIGQWPIGNDEALPPVRVWEEDPIVQPLRKQELAGLEEGSRQTVEKWVSKHAVA